ncbi:hypothetical protein [Mesorhizobium sp. AA23]|uniref:hypothetical protein n=1 Tax=Mesorhizobium sp. AA23 TaxID=1854058 RepID=UPI0007FCBCF6|nr:hypothetical protein [Mesorhizobium sp. AA23]OBQ96026.1 hypothetical protein A9K66_22785 [Mesorhizobium sp. AA23]
MQQREADTVDGWVQLAEQARAVAEMAMQNAFTRNFAWAHAGFACECLIKAAIMKKERLNSWPTRSSRRELYSHDLKELASILGLNISPADLVAPAWSVVLQWRREHMYISDEMPLRVVADLMDAVFSDEGVAKWISQNYLSIT